MNSPLSEHRTHQSFFIAIEWRASLFHSIDLSGAKTTWETFCKIVENCAGLTVLNMAKMKGEFSKNPVIRAVNIADLSLSYTVLDDSHLVFITES